MTHGSLPLAVGIDIDDADARTGPPWPMTPEELTLFTETGLVNANFEKAFDPARVRVFRY